MYANDKTTCVDVVYTHLLTCVCVRVCVYTYTYPHLPIFSFPSLQVS